MSGMLRIWSQYFGLFQIRKCTVRYENVSFYAWDWYSAEKQEFLSSSDLECFKSTPNLITNSGRQLSGKIHQSVNMTNEFHPASTLNPRPLHASTTWYFGTRTVPSISSKIRGKSTTFILSVSVQKTWIIIINVAEKLNIRSVILIWLYGSGRCLKSWLVTQPWNSKYNWCVN